tara:strand:+ start:26 stop:367 length:342 start_codon:yes stop_codon:yes gene_type:complete
MRKEPSEKEIENSILDYLQTQKGFFWKNNTVGVYDPVKKTFRRPTKYCINGVADILGVIPPDGKLVAIEVKSKKGRVSKNQEAFLLRVRMQNGKAFIARSIEDVQKELYDVQT